MRWRAWRKARSWSCSGRWGGGFDLAAAAAGEVILVGGGVGVPPLVHAAAELAPLTGTALIGAARGELLLCEEEFDRLGWRVRVATDDGSRGHHGFVTELLERALATAPRAGGGAHDRAGVRPPRHAAPLRRAGRRDWRRLPGRPGRTDGLRLRRLPRLRHPRPLPQPPTPPPAPPTPLVCRDGPVFPAAQVLW